MSVCIYVYHSYCTIIVVMLLILHTFMMNTILIHKKGSEIIFLKLFSFSQEPSLLIKAALALVFSVVILLPAESGIFYSEVLYFISI
jgi:predicted ferric reductase